MNARGRTLKDAGKLRALARDLDGHDYLWPITFADFRDCCIRVGIGHDKRTIRNWMTVATAFEMISQDKKSKAQLYNQGPRFSFFLGSRRGPAKGVTAVTETVEKPATVGKEGEAPLVK